MKSLISKFSLIFTITILLTNFSFSQGNVNEHSIKFDAANPMSALLVGENGVILKSLDGGATWQQQQSNVTNVLYGNAIVDSNTAFAVGENSVILETVDGGANWILSELRINLTLKDIVVIGSNVFICGDNGTLITSNDMMVTWNTQQISTHNLNDILAINGVIYIAGDSATLFKSIDGGVKWNAVQVITGATAPNFTGIGASDENHLTVIGDNCFIDFSSDGGATWRQPQTMFNAVAQYTYTLNSAVMFNATDGIIVGNNSLVLITNNGGLLWKNSQTPAEAPRDLMSVAFSSITNGITVGDLGYSLFTTDGGANWTSTFQSRKLNAGVTKTQKTVALGQNYPNPFNPSTMINYSLPLNSSVSLKVYDMLGQEVKNLVNAYQSSGSYNVRFDGSNLASGIYFYVLKVNDNHNAPISKTMRMILTK